MGKKLSNIVLKLYFDTFANYVLLFNAVNMPSTNERTATIEDLLSPMAQRPIY